MSQFRKLLGMLKIDKSLVGWWKLNDAIGSLVALDSSGNGFTGTLNGAIKPTFGGSGTGQSGTGDLIFLSTSTDQYVDCGNSPIINPTVAGSFSCWFNYSTTTAGAFTALVSNNNNGPEINGCFLGLYNIGAAPNGHHLLLFEVCSSSSRNQAFSTNGVPNNNGWNFACGTWDGTTVHLYVNGIEATTGGMGVSQTITPSPGFNLTYGNDGAHSSQYKDALDDVRVYNRALKASEVLDLYNAGAK